MSATVHEHDVIVVGAGGAGLRAAIAADEAGADAALVTKLHPVRSHTGAAEGGINAVLQADDSVERHAADTMKGSDYLGDAPAIEALCADAPEEVVRLEHWGMPFSRDADGTVSQRPFGGLSYPRTTYAGAETGHHLLHTLYQQVVKRGITVYDEWYVTRLAVTDEPDPAERTCHGVVAYDVRRGEIAGFRATGGVVLATGGLGQVYDHTTNAVSCTGDGQAMAYRAGVPLEDMEFVQFHPTTLPSTGVLVSEAVRGEGGILYNEPGERFMFERGYAVEWGEVASRDVVSRAELTEIQEGRGIDDEYVHLDMRHLGEERIVDRLENILHLAADFEGVDALAEPMPVKPGQHYGMGGVETDENGATCVAGLYAAGECACVSVHGANRLGGNALPELFVFGRRAGLAAAGADLGDPVLATGRSDDAEAGEVDAPVALGAVDDAGAVADGGDGTGGSGGRSPESSGGKSPGGSGGRSEPRSGRAGAASDPEAVVERAVEAERERVERLLERDEGVQQAGLRARLQRTMTEHVNVFRDEDGLEQALADVREVREAYQEVYVADPSRTFNTDLQQTLELRNLIDVAEAIAVGALARTEFRGAHWRREHQERRDDEWLKHTFVSWDGGDPSLWYRPVVLEGERTTYEPKERSY